MRIKAYIQIARPDHWPKNIFMLPGVVLAIFFSDALQTGRLWFGIAAGILSACLVASSNYVLNEILDSEKDKFHPEKRLRPIPSGQVYVPFAYAEWLALGAIGCGLGFWVDWHFGVVAVMLWIAGTLYNIPPVRLKDLAYGDVISESINNPLRLALGWYATGYNTFPPLSGLLAYWMFGAFLMAMKRYAEYRRIGDPATAGEYRRSFRYYNEERLIESLFFYGALFGMLSGIFIARYHVELVLATPLVAYAMAYYMHLGFKPDSPVQYPERLHRQKKLMLVAFLAFAACAVLLFTDLPTVERLLSPTGTMGRTTR